MIKLTYAAYRCVWLGRDRFEQIVDRIAQGALPERALADVGFDGAINWVRVGEATPESCPLKAFWRVVQAGNPEAVKAGRRVLMDLYNRFEG